VENFMRPICQLRRGTSIAIALGCLLSVSRPVLAQTFFEFSGGWNLMASTPPSDFYSRGISIRASLGGQVAPRVRWRVDAFTNEFDHDMQFYPPCAFPGCLHPYYHAQSVSVDGLTANALVDVDPTGILYVVGGTGLYDLRGPATELHMGVSVGAGIAVPVVARLRVVVEARWHALLGATAGPSWLVPLTFGIRF
jgi:hypothetical protein